MDGKRSGILVIKKNETGSFVETWVDPESVIQSEAILAEKTNQISYINHTCGIQKNGTDEPICRVGRETSFGHMNIYTPMCKIDHQWEAAIQHRDDL